MTIKLERERYIYCLFWRINIFIRALAAKNSSLSGLCLWFLYCIQHHCRKCGVVCCGACSTNRFLLLHQSSSPVRVCTPCYDQLLFTTQLAGVSCSSIQPLLVIRLPVLWPCLLSLHAVSTDSSTMLLSFGSCTLPVFVWLIRAGTLLLRHSALQQANCHSVT